MRYFLDTEFNGMGGDLISLALVCEDGRELYLAAPCHNPIPWIAENVIPVLTCEGARPVNCAVEHFGPMIASYLVPDTFSFIVSDWPDDIAYFCRTLITGPGQMVNIQRLAFQIERVDSYPTTLLGAVQHNALWDARALQAKITAK